MENIKKEIAALRVSIIEEKKVVKIENRKQISVNYAKLEILKSEYRFKTICFTILKKIHKKEISVTKLKDIKELIKEFIIETPNKKGEYKYLPNCVLTIFLDMKYLIEKGNKI